MNLWSRVSQLMWEEAEAPTEAPIRTASREAAGVPAFLRKATRLTAIGFAATMLTAQVVGIRMVAPVDAQNGYASCHDVCTEEGRACRALCRNKPPRQRGHCQGDCGRELGRCHRQCSSGD